MNFIKTAIDGVVIVEPKVFNDARGYFYESYNENDFKVNGIDCRFVQDNQSKSSYGVIRGLHCQTGEFCQAKLVRVLSGKVLDVAVDVRAGSKTFGQYVAVELSDENHRQLFIPRGFLHGFSVLSDTAVFSYKVDNFYNKLSEWGMRYDAPEFKIDWQVLADKVITSEKDRIEHSLKDVPAFAL
ncbi:dTDP-4-dehydrorhamnose 3,5-epimerase [Succinivibrio dextrinosolvens]|uniref:dTDP-4-dehydrorhamnose 3,5-epimerase n=1 Tax=Succinivibrio dextrinosolvens TaxID=83771 RepID=A0A662ZCG5_9GAMM|nr:dTDP-4-dehydrorhamnose 3,5-epimerase [Succinivibrio dextrinosolvens]SFK44498.1 dTDP-4-dehydrorhamnose 3,5-epimerase [Succinivibrio dextrinosolvens]